MKRIIAICGTKRSGKDVLANHIVNKYGYTKLSFAEPLKELVSKVSKNLNLDGILDLDIALDSNGDPKIIDVSARLSGSAGSGVIAGMNIFEVILNNYFSTTNEVNMKPKKIMIRPIKIFYELKK